jgi:hypothetical protein
MRNKVWIILIIILVISITPVSASQRSDLSKELADTNTKMEQSTNDVTQHGDNVAGYGMAIKDFGINIWDCTCFIVCNSWKWWKWGEVWNNICQIGIDAYYINEKIDDAADESGGTAISTFKLLFSTITVEDTLLKLDNSVPTGLNSDLTHQNLETNQEFTQNNNTNIVEKGNKTNTQYSNALKHQNTPIERLQLGDVVEYKSQGKYSRYLQFITNDNQTVYLKGPYDKSVTLTCDEFKKYYNGTVLRGDPKNLKASSKTVNNQYQTQKMDIQNRISENQNDTTNTKETRTYGIIVCSIGTVVTLIGTIGAIITYYKQKRISVNNANRLRIEANQLQAQKDMYLTQAENNKYIIEYENDEAYIYRDPQYYNFLSQAQSIVVPAVDTSIKLGKPFFCFILIAVIGVACLLVGAIMWGKSNNILDGLYSEANRLNDDLVDLNSWAVTDNLTAPVAGCLNFTTHEGSAINASLNGTDDYDDPLSYSILAQSANGNLSTDEIGGFIYKSNPGFVGNDSFTYNVQDIMWNLPSNVANVTITVNPDQAPLANNMSLFTSSTAFLNGILDANDPDNDTISYLLDSEPSHGTLKLAEDGFFVYIPFDNFTGEDSFTFKSNDSVLDSNIGNVTIHIVNNTSPIAYNMVFNIGQNSQLNSKFNITSINGTEQIFNIISKPSHGKLNIFGGNFTYKPDNNYNGQDMFTYNFTDILKQTSNLATIKIFIIKPPTAENIKLNTKMNTLIKSAFKIKGYNSTTQVISKPKHGKLTILANEKFSYQPNKDYTGTDTFTYQSIDKLGQKSPLAKVTLTITKPKLHTTQPTKPENIKILNKPLSTTSPPHINAPHLETLQLNLNNLNTTNLNMTGLNMANLTPESQTKLIINPLIALIKTAINNIKTTINNIKTTINNIKL